MFRRRNSTVMAAPRGNLDTWANGTWLNDWMVVNPSPSRRHTSRRLTPYGPVGRSINRGESIRTRTRHDQPSVRIGATADSSRALAAASSAEAQRAAIEELQRGIYAATSQAPQAALLRTWERFHNAWFCGCLDVIHSSRIASGQSLPCFGQGTTAASRTMHLRQRANMSG